MAYFKTNKISNLNIGNNSLNIMCCSNLVGISFCRITQNKKFLYERYFTHVPLSIITSILIINIV